MAGEGEHLAVERDLGVIGGTIRELLLERYRKGRLRTLGKSSDSGQYGKGKYDAHKWFNHG
jgi:hypothetical protein